MRPRGHTGPLDIFEYYKCFIFVFYRAQPRRSASFNYIQAICDRASKAKPFALSPPKPDRTLSKNELFVTIVADSRYVYGSDRGTGGGGYSGGAGNC